jgi:two-component system chemotaxis sensor kinase CheA
VEAAISSEHSQEWIAKKCRIPSVVADVLVQKAGHLQEQAEDVLDIVKHVTAPAEDEAEIPIRAEETTPAEPSASPATNSRAPAPADSQSASFASMSETLLRVDAEKIDSVLNLVGELIIAKSMLHQAINEFDKRYPKDPLKMRFSDAMAFQARIMNDLQKSVMKIRMVPVEHLFRRFTRVVRDVAKSCGKEVNLAVTGQNTDLDKSILDMLAEPLAHLVRNAVDHGIESPAERINDGKSAQGTVTLDAYHQGNQIVIEVRDNGRGIDRDRLIAKAVERGLLKAGDAAALGESEINNLVFHPGLSTADQVTSVSGRGVGMDVVKTVLKKLKGSVSIRTTPGKGTTFYLKVPLTLAIIKALLFRVGDRLYAVPLASVVEITRTTQDALHRVDNHDVMQLRNEVLTLLHLHRLEKEGADRQKMFVVVISTGERKFGLVVDHLVGEEELVIKAMDDHLVATDLVSGASILGDGTVVLILNLSSVVAKLGRLQMVEATA